MYALKKESKLVAPPRKVNIQQLKIAEFERDKLVRFLITVGSILRSLTRTGNK